MFLSFLFGNRRRTQVTKPTQTTVVDKPKVITQTTLDVFPKDAKACIMMPGNTVWYLRGPKREIIQQVISITGRLPRYSGHAGRFYF